MKTKFSRFGRSSVSVILAVMMLLSTMLVGTVTTVNAASSITSDGTAVFYFNPNPNDWWSSSKAKLYLYFFGDSNGAKWSNEATVIDSSHAYVKIPSGTYSKVILTRMNPDSTSEIPSWDAKWNQTGDIELNSSTTNNYISNFSDGSTTATWDDYIQTSTAKLDADNTSVTEGTAVTFTPSLTSNANFNDIKSTSYSVKKVSDNASSSDYSIDGNKITFNTEGSYTVTANITYNAKGFSDITKTTTATTDITVESSSQKYSVTYALGTDSTGKGSVSAKSADADIASGAQIEEGKSVTFKATANDGYEFVGWYGYAACTGEAVNTNAEYTVSNISADTAVYAKFTEKEYTVSHTQGTGYTISGLPTAKVKYNDTVSFTVTPAEGYKIDSVKANDEILTASDGSYSFTMPANDVTVTVTASLNSHSISNESADLAQATFTVDGKEVSEAKMGDTVTVSAEKTGYTLSSISVVADNGETVEISDLTFTMPASAVKVTLNFDVISYNVTVAENANCTVTVGSEKYDYDSTVSFTVEPKAGFNVTDVTAETAKGNKVTVSGSVASGYTFTMPADNVTITVTTEAVDVAAPKVTLNGGAGQTTDNISANQNYPVTAKAEAGDEFSTIKDGAVPTVSCDVENADYDFVKDELTGIYNFNAKTAGTYTITYTATAKSNNSDKENSATATLVIKVTYTETQEAYNALSTYVNSDAITNAVANKPQYTVESYTAFETALTAAQKLLTGLPVASDENKAAYTEALTALKTAFGKLELEVNYYIGGRFMGQSWNPSRTDFPMSKVDGTPGLYKFETGKTVAQLSAKVDGVDQYFLIHTGNGYNDFYGSSSNGGHNFENNTKSNPLSLSETSGNQESKYIKFTDTTDNSSNVVIYFDLTDKDNPKLYYTAECDPQMRINGSVNGGTDGWNNNYNTALKFDYRDSDGSFVKTFNITANDITSSNNFFRLIDKSVYASGGKHKEYGPYVTDTVRKNVAIDNYTSSTNAYTTYENSATPFFFESVGTYKLHYTMGSSTPKVWVEYTAEKRDVTFSITGESGNVKLNDETVKNEDVKSLVVGSSYTITVTPEDDSYIKTFTVDGNAVEGKTYTAKISDDVKVVVEFAKKTVYSVTAGTSDGGSVAIDPTNAYEGQTVTVTTTANDGYVLESISAKTNTDEKAVELTKNSDGTYTFSMPADNVTIQANFRTKNTYTVKVSSDNQELGSVALNGSSNTLETTVEEGDTVTIKANPTGSNIFKSWSINGTYTIKDSKTTSDAAITLVVNSHITATASFTQAAAYQVAYGSDGTKMSMYATKKQGIYVSSEKIAVDDIFTIFDSSANKYAFSEGKDNYWINDVHPTPSIVNWVDNYSSARKALNKYKTAKYVIFDSVNNFIALSDTPEYSPKLTLYVKPGTVSYDGSSGSDNSKYASSSVAKGLTTTKTSPCNTYTVSDGDNITITTKMSETYKNLGYYVAAYCVNGINYNASLSAEADTYQANITVSTEIAVNNSIEVTPIYYNKTIEANGDYITFYVDANEALKSWGNTLSVDPYCYSTSDDTVHFFEKYPGQPLVKDGQYYVTKISKYYYRNNNGTLEKTTDTVSGITLNNYYNDSVHKILSPSGRNMQTYDFSDFVKLSDMEDVKTILFQNKFYNADDTAAVKNYDYAFSGGKAATKLNDLANADTNKKVNTWQDFTDYYGRDTDALGNILFDLDKTQPCLYIISTGSHDTRSQAHATKGEWATKWCVYDNDGNFITCGTPADFLDSTSAQYTALNKEEYLNKPVKISYEKGTKYDNGYSRSDGRWYYSRLGQEFTSDVAIEYKGDNGTYTADTNTNSANTGFIGETSGATATINNVTTASFTSVTDTAHLNIKVANGWRFDGWYIKDNKIGDNYTDISTDILMSNSYHIVGRVSKIPTGTLELNHMAYTGTDPAAHTGTGFYYISAILKKADGSEVVFDETQGIISIDKFAEDDKLTITLSAKCHGDNTVYALYEGEAGGYTEIGPEDKDLRGESEFTYTFTVPAGSLFKNGKLGVNALNYYTDIVKVGGTCDITYKYYDRFSVEGEGNMVSYVVRNIELSTYEITHGYIPTNETITKYAPRIDTMYVDTKWNLADSSKVELGKSQATVIATQTDKTCDVYYPNKDGGYYTDLMNRKTVAYNTLFKDDNGNFILSAPETDESGKLFTYWEVYKVNANGEHTELVTKCYERNFGLRIMADYYIVPVYDGKAPTLTANINTPVLNREIYGDSTSATDKLYVDLLTAFTSTAIPTFKENTTNLTVECGVFVLRNNTTKLSDTDRTTLVTAALAKDDDTTSTILANNYMRSADTETFVVAKLKELAQDSSVKDKSNTLATFDNDQYRITKLIFDNNSLTNKNRIDEVLKFTNNTANQNYIFTAYAFVVIKNSDGTVSEMQISDPQYFNLCYVGNKAL